MNTYDIGDRVRVKATFTNDAGAVTDPTTVTLKVKNPAGDITTYTATPPTDGAVVKRTSAGVFYGDIDLNQRGGWSYRWEGTGAAIAADEGQFTVERSAFYP